MTVTRDEPDTVRSTPRPSGAWRPGDPVGQRRFVAVGDVPLERGGVVPEVVVAYETWGTLDADGGNAVLVEHALTGDSHVVGPAGPGHPSPGWWEGLVGPGRPLDTDRWFVVAANVLGGCQGTTGPASPTRDGRPWGGRFPFVTVRDQVQVEARLADALGIRRWAGVVGGSMGGMRAVEWAVTHPERVARLMVLASTAAATADQIAWAQPQLLAIREDPDFRGGDYYDAVRGPEAGLGIARRIAHVTYRSGEELDERFGRAAQGGEQPLGAGGRYAVESYLDHHAGKLARRFDANAYVVLTEAMSSHDVGRDRGGVPAALARVTATTTVLGVDSDRLYPVRLSEELAAGVPGARLATISSRHGHDGFLVEVDQVGAHLRALLDEPPATAQRSV
ncbi:homoserine O-acetyltransferase MetX [Lapillicoccus jejuensis]|uniref:Homoserine O-acetyltransferase n=1 Tax=Lapillicoccus jejuensis TaxID=402171 RepID=A0A542E6S8_9MICO|nr:homoserine O-acetyltransferase [Lapillicoccus jejuensis]TQJ11043.1 homoserine O-acetyltransferase [Lapillicoccus jejuensis]